MTNRKKEFGRGVTLQEAGRTTDGKKSELNATEKENEREHKSIHFSRNRRNWRSQISESLKTHFLKDFLNLFFCK